MATPLKKGKEAVVVAYQFNCLAAHEQWTARGKGSSARVAAMRAIEGVWRIPAIKGKRVQSFKISVVITDLQTEGKVSGVGRLS